MTETSPPSDRKKMLRRKAEMQLKGVSSLLSEDGVDQRALHELRVHQIELEMQNQELVEQQRVIETARARYADLYAQYVSLFDHAPIGYLVHDYSGRIQETNIRLATMLSVPKGKLIGRSITDFIHREDQDIFHFHRVRCMASEDRASCKLRMIKKGGKTFHAQLHSLYFREEKEQSAKIRTAVSDVSKEVLSSRYKDLVRRFLETANSATDVKPVLDAAVSEIKSYLDCEAVGIRIRNRQGLIPYEASNGFSHDFLETEANLAGNNGSCLCTQVISGETIPAAPFFKKRGSFFVNDFGRYWAALPEAKKCAPCRLCTACGYASVVLTPIFMGASIIGLIHAADRRQKVFSVVGVKTLEELAIHIGVTVNRLSLQDELKTLTQELKFMSTELLKTQEEEQRRLSLELHDQLGQDLSVLKIKMTLIRDRLRRDQAAVKAEIEDQLAFLDKTIDNIRHLAHLLNPAMLEDLGINIALQSMIREFSQVSGIRITFDPLPLQDELDRQSQIVVYRIVQEAMTNVLKHAKADRVWISMQQSKEMLTLRIKDNGKGFDASARQYQKMESSRMGLSAMEFRARLIGGKLNLNSREGYGTEIAFSLPLQKKEASR